MPKFIIKDWAGNTKFDGETFKTFDDAWDHISVYLYNLYPNDDAERESWYQEYYVDEIKDGDEE